MLRDGWATIVNGQSMWARVARGLKSRRALVRIYFEALYLKRQSAYRSSNPKYEYHRDTAFALLGHRAMSTGWKWGVAKDLPLIG